MSIPISVIIPTYNRPELVPLAINSVLAQSHPAAEIIIVDDGSNQDMREILVGYGDKLRVIRQPNGGLSAARNTGILAAKHDWVSFLDDDDEYAPERLAQAAESIRRHPMVDVHLTNTAIVSEDGSQELNLFQTRGMPNEDWMVVAQPLRWVLRGCFFAQSLVVRRSVLEDIGCFRETFYEDMDLYVRLVRHFPWIIDGKPGLYLIRRGNTEAMSDDWRSKPVMRCEALVRIHREALALPGLTAEEKRAAQAGLGTYLFQLGSAYLASGEKAKARVSFNEAARAFPTLHSRAKSRLAAFCGQPVIDLLHALRRHRKSLVR